MKKSCWNDLEIKKLFQVVEETKGENLPLKNAFAKHAKEYNRKANSVRNFYYYQLETLSKDKEKVSTLGIDLEKHKKFDFIYFSPQEEKSLIEKVDNLVQSGSSVRQACLSLSGGDVNLMLRYQNKYRNFISKNKRVKNMGNIITFTNKKKSLLSESDITSLFLGLVRLVKKNAIDEFQEKDKLQRDSATLSLKKALVDLNKKDKEIERVKEELLRLKLENSRLVQNMVKLKCEKAERLSSSSHFAPQGKIDG